MTKKSTKVLGLFRTGTAIGDLVSALKDGSPHKLNTLRSSIRKRYKLANGWNGIQVVRAVGKRTRKFSVTADRKNGTVQVKVKKAAAPKTSSAKVVNISTNRAA
jgi:hypothetical protein